MKTLYLEGASGISGDMTVGALLDLGGDLDKVRAALASMPVAGYAIDAVKTRKWGFAGTSFTVTPDGGHAHDHAHDHGHAHAHVHRRWPDIEKLLAEAALTDRARAYAQRAFRLVAEAEAAAHGVPVDAVHFHEVGAVDSICDIVAAAVLFDDLGFGACAVTGLAEGSGLVTCAHGALPVPVPAVVNIARDQAIPLRLGTAETELVTPTGIALAAAFRTRDTLPQAARIVRTGIGFGTREIGRANILRAIVLDEAPGADATRDERIVLETNVDDATGEELGVCLERIMAAGACDCHFTPCFMKKGRPGWLVRVIAEEARVPELERILFRETTTIGIRRYRVARTVMAREERLVAVDGGNVRVKCCRYGDIARRYPEADDVRAFAERRNLGFSEARARIRPYADS